MAKTLSVLVTLSGEAKDFLLEEQKALKNKAKEKGATIIWGKNRLINMLLIELKKSRTQSID